MRLESARCGGGDRLGCQRFELCDFSEPSRTESRRKSGCCSSLLRWMRGGEDGVGAQAWCFWHEKSSHHGGIVVYTRRDRRSSVGARRDLLVGIVARSLTGEKTNIGPRY